MGGGQIKQANQKLTEVVKAKDLNHSGKGARSRPDRTCQGENAGEVRGGKSKETPSLGRCYYLLLRCERLGKEQMKGVCRDTEMGVQNQACKFRDA